MIERARIIAFNHVDDGNIMALHCTRRTILGEHQLI